MVKMVEDGVVGYWKTNNETIIFHERVCFPNDKELRENVLKESHQSKFSIHPGATKMYHDLKRYYHWSGMKRDVAGWVEKCPTCQLVNAKHQVPSGLLQNLPMPDWKWDMITMDFMCVLPKTMGCKGSVRVIVDLLTKSAHFLLFQMPDGVDKCVELLICSNYPKSNSLK